MWKKILLGIIVAEILISWPLSLVRKPVKISFETIFYPTTQEESLDFQQKLALDTSQIKRFYYNQTTIIKKDILKIY